MLDMLRRLKLIYLCVIFLLLFTGGCDADQSATCIKDIRHNVMEIISFENKRPIDIMALQDRRTALKNKLHSCVIPNDEVEVRPFGRFRYIDLLVIADDLVSLAATIDDSSGHIVTDKTKLVGGVRLMHLVAGYGTPGAIKILVSHGGDVNIVEDYGNTPLMESIGGLQLDIENTKLLTEMGADINVIAKSGMTALTMAVVARDIVAVRYLLDNGALIYPNGIEDNSIIDLANRIGDKSIIDLLERTNRGRTNATD